MFAAWLRSGFGLLPGFGLLFILLSLLTAEIVISNSWWWLRNEG
jgi:hypothetical protein